MGLQAKSTVFAQDFRSISSTKEHTLGVLGETIDGRKYRYSLAGGATLAPGKVAVNADLVALHTNIAVGAAAAIGAKTVTVTLGATAMTESQYQDGYLTVNDATGEGINYLINNNPAADASASAVISLAEPVAVALVAATSEVTLKVNTYSGIVISAADQVDQAVGVPNVSITNAYYGWVQTHGECPVLADEAVSKGTQLEIGSSVPGAVEAVDEAAAVATTGVVGIASEALVDTEYRSVFLTLD